MIPFMIPHMPAWVLPDQRSQQAYSPRPTSAALRSSAIPPWPYFSARRMPGLYGQVTEACRQAGFVPKAVQKDVWLMQTIVGLVAGGIGVALVPCSLRNLHRSGVVYKAVYGLSPTVELGVVWRRDDLGVVLSSFLRAVRESFRLR